MAPQIFVVSLLAENVPLTAHFYCDVLGLTLMDHQGGKPHFDLGGSYLVLIQGKPALGSERFPLIAITVDDLDARLKNLEAHHVALPWGIESDRDTRWAMFYDPAGNLIELVQPNSQNEPG